MSNINALNRYLLHYLLFAARTFLILSFFALLITAAIAYCVLPDSITENANSYYRIEVWSKGIYFCALLGSAFVYALFFWFLFHSPFVERRLRGNEKTVKYWDRDENFDMRSKIAQFWGAIMGGTMYILFTLHFIQLFPVNLSVPLQGATGSTGFGLLLVLLPLVFFLLGKETLAVVKLCNDPPCDRP
jgi:hypothetical protein